MRSYISHSDTENLKIKQERKKEKHLDNEMKNGKHFLKS